MGKIKLGLSRRNIENKIQFGTDVDNSMSSNPIFSPLAGGQSNLVTAKTTLQTKWTESNAAKQLAQQKATEVQDAEADFDSAMTKVANDVENLANGDVSIIQAAGMDVKNPPSAPQIPVQPVINLIEEGTSSGTINLKWKSVKGAKSYNIEMNSDVNNQEGWVIKLTTTKLKVTISGLSSGMKYWFRVTALGAAGTGSPSDPAVKYAP